MLRSSRVRSQDGFIREILWVAVIIAIIAIVMLDGMALFNAHQSAHDSAATAAKEALTEYAQTTNLPAAKLAAVEYLAKSGAKLEEFKAAQTSEGNVVFSVTASASADTYAFRYLKAIPPLKDWVERVTHPTGTETSD